MWGRIGSGIGVGLIGGIICSYINPTLGGCWFIFGFLGLTIYTFATEKKGKGTKSRQQSYDDDFY